MALILKSNGEEIGSSYYVNYNGHEANLRDEVMELTNFQPIKAYY